MIINPNNNNNLLIKLKWNNNRFNNKFSNNNSKCFKLIITKCKINIKRNNNLKIHKTN